MAELRQTQLMLFYDSTTSENIGSGRHGLSLVVKARIPKVPGFAWRVEIRYPLHAPSAAPSSQPRLGSV